MARINRERFFRYWEGVATLNRKISQGEVCTFLKGLYELKCLYHCDEKAADHSCFSVTEANQLDAVIMPKMRKALLPDYENDIHQISLALINRNEWIYPSWGFSFDDSDEPNLYEGYRQTGTWNGWQRPLMDAYNFLKFMEDTCKGNNDLSLEYDRQAQDRGERIAITLIERVSRTAMLSEGGDQYERTYYTPKPIETRRGTVWVYETDGYCFEAGDCLESNHIHWKGYY